MSLWPMDYDWCEYDWKLRWASWEEVYAECETTLSLLEDQKTLKQYQSWNNEIYGPGNKRFCYGDGARGNSGADCDGYGALNNFATHAATGPTSGKSLAGPLYETGFTKNLVARRYTCKMCAQVFDTKSHHQVHLQTHLRQAKPYRCTRCPRSFANNSYLAQHTRIHLGLKPHKCNICSRNFTQLSHLQQHIRTHTGEKPYKCPHQGCSKSFSQLSNLQSHSRTHETAKPFKCNSCYRSFPDKQTLQHHIPKHIGSKHLKTHICRFCGRSYTQATYLANHLKKHADEAKGSLFQGENVWPKMDSRCFQPQLPYEHRMPATANQSIDFGFAPTDQTSGPTYDFNMSAFSALPSRNFYQDPFTFPGTDSKAFMGNTAYHTNQI